MTTVKHCTAVFILAFGTSLSVLAQTHDSGSLATDQHIHDGTISSGIYTNEFFEFSIEIPAGWDPELAKLGQRAEINAPLLMMIETLPWVDGKHRYVRILSTDASWLREALSAEEFLRFTADTNRKFGLSAEYVTKPEPIQLGGRTAWKAYFNQHEPVPQGAVRWYSVNVAVVSKKHILQFILESPDEEGLRSLEKVLRAVRFKD